MRRALATVTAALGVVCLLLFPAASAYSQLSGSLSIYDASGVGQGVVSTFAIRPSIFDPLAQGGMYYAQTQTTSQGGGRSYAISSQTFPGSFAVGAIGCAGIHGALWAQGSYPETDQCRRKQEATLYRPERSSTGQQIVDDAANAVLDHVDFALVHTKSEAALGYSDASVESLEYALLGMDGRPVIAVEDFDLHGTSRATGSRVEQRTIVLAKGVTLLDGGISIDTIRSAATTSTDGLAATADATLTFAGVTVTVDGKQRRATIDEQGVRVTDPSLDRKQRLGLNEQIQEDLAKAGITIAASSPTEIVEGARAEASVGGLSIAVSGTLPSVAIPSELAPALGMVLDRVPTSCLSDFGAPIPLCFGAGVVPGFGSEFPLTLQIASATAFSAASTNVLIGPRDGLDGDGGFGAPTDPALGGDGFEPVVTPGEGPASDPASDPPVFDQGGPLTGLVARLPAVALLWVGMALFVVAVGIGLGPSLRHAGAP